MLEMLPQLYMCIYHIVKVSPDIIAKWSTIIPTEKKKSARRNTTVTCGTKKTKYHHWNCPHTTAIMRALFFPTDTAIVNKWTSTTSKTENCHALSLFKLPYDSETSSPSLPSFPVQGSHSLTPKMLHGMQTLLLLDVWGFERTPRSWIVRAEPYINNDIKVPQTGL